MYILEDKRPRLSFRGWMGVLFGWMFWSAILFSGPLWRNGSLLPDGMEVVSLLWPLAAVAGFAVMMRWKMSQARTANIAAEKIRRYGALWQCVYAAAWLMALQLFTPAMWMLGFAIASAAIVMVVKEATGASGKPISWRI